MRTLLVFRHAKARRAPAGMDDHERPLSNRGRSDAEAMGRLLRREDLVPEVVLASTAVRARTTAELAGGAGGFGDLVETGDELYEASARTCLDLVRRRGGDAGSVMIVGHNPAFGTLVEALGHRPVRMPAGGLAVIEAEVDAWSELGPAASRLARLWEPAGLG